MADGDLATLEQRTDFPELVAAERDELIAFWSDGAVDPANLKPGTPLYDLVATPAAEAQAVNRERVDVIRRSSSLYELVKDPSLADDEAVDRVLSNYPTRARNPGGTAKGYVAIYRDAETIFVIPRGATFRSGDLSYSTEDVYVATPFEIATPHDRKMTTLADGTWRVVIPVMAEGQGEKYGIAAGTPLEWEYGGSQINIVRAEAATDFTGGKDPETNAELLERQDSMIAAPGMAGRMNIEALLRRKFPEIVDISIIGAGDPEMQRDGRNVLGLKVGGKSDCYIRTSHSLATLDFDLAAEVVDAASGLLRIRVGRDVYPGFYMMTSIRRHDSVGEGSLEVSYLSYGKDTSGLPHDPPEMERITDYRFTRYQTMTFEFVDPEFTPDNLSYRVTLTGIPSIGEIQDYVADRSVRSPNNDMLVKAAIPAFTAVNVTLRHQRAGEAIEEEEVRAAIRATVNRTRFRDGALSTAAIACAVKGVLPDTAQVAMPVDALAAVLLPESGQRMVRSTTELTAPSVPAESVSSRTVAFYCTGAYATLEPVNPVQV